MKKARITLLGIAVFSVLMVFQNCGGDDKEDPAAVTKNLLMSKTWVVSSVNVPDNTATLDSDWVNFTVSFSETNMSTNGHPTGASAVWPSVSYAVSEDGKSVTRADGVVMLINPITSANFTAAFTVPDGTEIGGRIEALGGDYTFSMK